MTTADGFFGFPGRPLAGPSTSRRAVLAALPLGLAAPGPCTTSARAMTIPTAPGLGAATPEAAGGLALRGVNYDIGTAFYPGTTTRAVWERPFVEREIAAIRDDLRANAIQVYGSDPGRLLECAEIAAEMDLAVWLQPRAIDAAAPAMAEELRLLAREAARMRGDGLEVGLNLGAEFSIFAAGIVPGATWVDRFAHFGETWSTDLQAYNEGLNVLLRDLVGAVRGEYAGPLTYGSGIWEFVDWDQFDLVGVNHYRDATNRDAYTEQLRAYARIGKPVVVTEFGCCAWEGAEDLGALGYDIVDWEATPLQLNGGYVRSEQTQAAEIGSMLDLFAAEAIHGAFVFGFIEPDMPTSPDPRTDLDMASFSVVKVFPNDSERAYAVDGYWEPKLAVAAIAERFGAAG
jgi:hypothetical protein